MSAPKYVQRIARLPRVFEYLATVPDGMPLREVAERFAIPTDQLRQDLLAYYTADVPPDLLGLSRPGVLEFLAPDGSDADPNDAEIVRIVDVGNADELGVEYVDASELALIYTAARSLLDVEPDNADLEAAVDVLAETMFGDAAPEEEERPPWHRALDLVWEGQTHHRQVAIVYSRAWEPGVSERVIEPYHLVRTRRGWEVDAGPLDGEATMRTFLLANVREARLLDEPFEPPSDLPKLVDEHRATTTVRVRIPQSARWAVDMYAERVRVLDDGELAVELELDLLPPLRRRLGQLLLASGRSARVLEPAELADCGAELARELLAHYRDRVDA